METVMTLLKTETVKNDKGVQEPILTPREVFCKVKSVTRNEFFEAGRNGLNPEYEATVFSGDYRGERVCVLNGMRYAIYRTYKGEGDDYTELYLQREGGTNGTSQF